jgi:hypothetical protein
MLADEEINVSTTVGMEEHSRKSSNVNGVEILLGQMVLYGIFFVVLFLLGVQQE